MLGAPRVIPDLDARVTEANKSMPLGTYSETEDGRGFRYTLAGGTDLAPGKLGVAATVDSNVQNVQAGEAAAVGATSVVVEAGAAITVGVYADGFLTVNDADGEGISYRVKHNLGVSGAADMTVILHEPIKVALVADTSEVSLSKNPWGDVVISATDQADLPVGVPNVTIPDAEYGWVQTKGACSVLADEAITAGKSLTIGTGVAGAVEMLDAAGEPEIGWAFEAGVDTEYHLAYLTID